MPSLRFWIPDDLEALLRTRAKIRGVSLSTLIGSILSQEVKEEWPRDFFETVVGGWQGTPLKRPPQGRL